MILIGRYFWVAFFAVLMSGGVMNSEARGATVIVMSDDSDHDSLPARSLISRTVARAIEKRLAGSGHRILDPFRALPKNTYGEKRVERRRLVEWARKAADGPVDILGTYTIYVFAHPLGKSFKERSYYKLLISGRLIFAFDLRVLAQSNIDNGRGTDLPRECTDKKGNLIAECAIANINAGARKLADRLGRKLVSRLDMKIGRASRANKPRDDARKTRKIDLIVRGLEPSEILAIEEYVVVLPGYVRHFLIEADSKRTHYRLRIRNSGEAIRNELGKIMQQLGVKGAQLDLEGNKLVVTK